MLDSITFNNIDGTHNYSINDVQSPSTLFDVTVNPRTDTSREKSQNHGVNPTITGIRGGMEIHIEGSLFADNSTDYATERKALIAALYGDPNDAIDITKTSNGTLVVRINGETEDWKADCAVMAFTAPVRALYPALSEYAITFFSWLPYFIGSSSGDYYYWS